MIKVFKSLNDASRLTKVADLSPGSTEIWYANSDTFMHLLPTDVNVADLSKTHTKLGGIAETDLNRIVACMQGEVWSPMGEARELIRGLGLSHTTMYISDIIVLNGQAYWVDFDGFRSL